MEERLKIIRQKTVIACQGWVAFCNEVKERRKISRSFKNNLH